jgi:Enoyl-CoA hydratase/isomerase
MDLTSLDGPAFTRAVATGDLYQELAGTDGSVVVVEADDLPDQLEAEAMGRLVTLAAVVVARTSATDRRPRWADLVMAPDDPLFGSVLDTVRSRPLAATVLALLLRSGDGRSVQEGLAAESTAYGLLQAGPEFEQWRAGRPKRQRGGDDGPPVLVERHGDELAITLNRPSVRNALDSAMRDGLVEALTVAEHDPSVTVVHLRGAGEAFCSGGDLDEFGSRSDPATAHLVRMISSPARALADLADRTVVQLHGDTVGSGIELAAFAGRVVASPDTRISLPEIGLGLIPGAGGTVSLPRRIGRHLTLRLALAPEPIGVDAALGWGLVDEVTD